MKKQKVGYQIVDFPRVREIVVDVMVPAERKHMIHVLFEADVTEVRKYREKKKAEGSVAPSITAFIIKCVADAAMTNKGIATLRFAPRKLAIFDDMHVSCNVEKEIDGQNQPMGLVVRQANRKSIGARYTTRFTTMRKKDLKSRSNPSRNLQSCPGFCERSFYPPRFPARIESPNKVST